MASRKIWGVGLNGVIAVGSTTIRQQVYRVQALACSLAELSLICKLISRNSRWDYSVSDSQRGKLKFVLYTPVADVVDLLQAQLLHAATESGCGQAEDLGRAALAGDAAAGVLQNFANMSALHLVQRG